MVSAKFRNILPPRWLRGATALLLVAFGSNWAAAGSEFTDDEPLPYIHDHAHWTASIGPVLVSMTDWERGIPSDARSRYGIVAVLTRRVSRVTMLDFGLEITSGAGEGDRVPVYQFAFGPKFLMKSSQKDRFYGGFGGTMLASDTPGRGSRWGWGLHLSLGVDYAISKTNCLYIDGTFGEATLNDRPRRSSPPDSLGHWPEGGDVLSGMENGVAWAQLTLGLRFPL